MQRKNGNETMGQSASGVSRRAFITGSAATALSAGALAVLGGCAPKGQSATADNQSATADNKGLAPSPWGDYYPWPMNPPEIADADVEEELDCDVAVVGLGVSGVAAFRAACEGGAKVIGIEKASKPVQRSSQYCYLNGALTDHFGLPRLDLEEIIEEEFKEGLCLPNYSIIRKFIFGDAEAMDWWIEGSGARICEPGEMLDMSAMMDPSIVPENNINTMSRPDQDYKNERQVAYPECMSFGNHQMVLDNNLQRGLDASAGSEAFFGHFAEKLIQDETGRVVGVYARNAETGKYKKINAAKGVCMATGCFRGNDDMLRYFAPQVLFNGNGLSYPNFDVENNICCTGDGYPMGYWVGASIQQHQCAQTHIMGDGGPYETMMGGPTIPILRLNLHGKRFMNEDTCAADAEGPIELQPQHMCWAITDGHFEEINAISAGSLGMANLAAFDAEVEAGSGAVFKGETLKELFSQIEGMDIEQAVASVERYNKMCTAGKDDDFAKKQKYLVPVDQGPFYACYIGVGYCLVMMGGLESDENAHVLDVDRNIIPGLFASGNVQGSRFTLKYPFRLSGHSHAMAMFYGKVAGENAAAGK